MMAYFVCILRYLTLTMSILACLSAVLMAALVITGTVMRYFLGSPLMFSDELVGYMFVSMSFLAFPMGLLKKRHISVDLVVRNIDYPIRRIIDLLGILIFIIFAAVFIFKSFEFADFSRQINARSDIGALLVWPWMMLMPVSLGVATLVALIQLIDTIRMWAGCEPLVKENREEVPDIKSEEHL
ncbi:TRAP transporter small permease [Desulfotignum balticum]|uniref:TRAP transporter small permease n=1 Tax=Desulfotignum balticum TaxID=115781 RepID=UPI000462E5EB|nr:TRAP transporter small permease [Desulfotignum balticum]